MRIRLASALFLVIHAAGVALGDLRALWVTRWDYKSERDVVSIMANTAAYGFNTVLFQVRGNGTVFYRSRVEPWAWELTGDCPESTGRDPGWDPLRIAVREARREGLSIHAYFNVLPGWRGTERAPELSGQIWSVHPDWFMVDAFGRRMQPYDTWYTFLSPHNPQARKHILKLIAELAGGYNIDGIHLDYFRFPADYRADRVYKKVGRKQLEKHKDFSYDPYALQGFKEAYGCLPEDWPEGWAQFRRDTLTSLLRDIRTSAHIKRPSLTISCAVVVDPVRAKNMYFQDSTRWLREGLLDLAFPMNYGLTDFDEKFSSYCAAVGDHFVGRVVMGISLAHSARQIERQVTLSRDHGLAGVALFTYSSIFNDHEPTQKANRIKRILTRQN